jgi:hypothetical protein
MTRTDTGRVLLVFFHTDDGTLIEVLLRDDLGLPMSAGQSVKVQPGQTRWFASEIVAS